ncbi:MAG TPA: hypothetical protein VGS41_09460, partial [Chthonomonadales bacterium]|nr:hypothetical protein [Chthonomonadales bacterium]
VGNAYASSSAPALPQSLGEATERFRASRCAREWLGEPFVEHFCITRDWERSEFERAVTDWELKRYLETI